MADEMIGVNLSLTDRETLERIEAKLDLVIDQVYKGQQKPKVDEKAIRGKALGKYKKLGNK